MLWIWNLLLNTILPLLSSCWGFSFGLVYRVSFVSGIPYSPANGCSVVSCNFGVLSLEEEHTSFYSAILESNINHTSRAGEWVFIMLVIMFNTYDPKYSSKVRNSLRHVQVLCSNVWLAPHSLHSLGKSVSIQESPIDAWVDSGLPWGLCLNVICGSAVDCWKGRGSGSSRPGNGISLLGGGHH